MALRNNLLVSAAVLPFAFVVTVACSSDESTNDNTSAGGPSTATNTATATATQTSTAAGSTTVTNTTAATTASANTATNTRTSTSSTTATSGGASTTGNAANSTTGAGGGTSTDTSSSTAGGGAGGTSGTSTTGGSTEFTLTSPAFADDGTCSADATDSCEMFPTENVFFGDNVSPELTWTAGPTGTLSYVVVLYDMTLDYSTHWALWNLSAETLSLPAGLPSDATLTTPVEGQQANAPFGTGDGYTGPGSCMNVYEFKVYALDVETFTPSNTAMLNVRQQLETSENVLGSAILRGQANPDAC